MQLGFKTILVLSGGTSLDGLHRYAYRPDKVVDSIADLGHERLLQEFSRPGSRAHAEVYREIRGGLGRIRETGPGATQDVRNCLS